MTKFREALDNLVEVCGKHGFQAAVTVGYSDNADIAAAEAAVLALYDKALAWKGVAERLAEALDNLVEVCGKHGFQAAVTVGYSDNADIAAAEAAVLALYDKALAWKGVAERLAEALEVSQPFCSMCSLDTPPLETCRGPYCGRAERRSRVNRLTAAAIAAFAAMEERNE